MVEIKACKDKFCVDGKMNLKYGILLSIQAVYENNILDDKNKETIPTTEKVVVEDTILDDKSEKTASILENRLEKAFKDFVPINETITIVNKVRETFKGYEESSLIINVDGKNSSIFLFFKNGALDMYRRIQNGVAIRYHVGFGDIESRITEEAFTTSQILSVAETLKLASSEVSSFNKEKAKVKALERKHVKEGA